MARIYSHRKRLNIPALSTLKIQVNCATTIAEKHYSLKEGIGGIPSTLSGEGLIDVHIRRKHVWRQQRTPRHAAPGRMNSVGRICLLNIAATVAAKGIMAEGVRLMTATDISEADELNVLVGLSICNWYKYSNRYEYPMMVHAVYLYTYIM